MYAIGKFDLIKADEIFFFWFAKYFEISSEIPNNYSKVLNRTEYNRTKFPFSFGEI